MRRSDAGGGSSSAPPPKSKPRNCDSPWLASVRRNSSIRCGPGPSPVASVSSPPVEMRLGCSTPSSSTVYCCPPPRRTPSDCPEKRATTPVPDQAKRAPDEAHRRLARGGRRRSAGRSRVARQGGARTACVDAAARGTHRHCAAHLGLGTGQPQPHERAGARGATRAFTPRWIEWIEWIGAQNGSKCDAAERGNGGHVLGASVGAEPARRPVRPPGSRLATGLQRQIQRIALSGPNAIHDVRRSASSQRIATAEAKSLDAVARPGRLAFTRLAGLASPALGSAPS